MAVLTSVLAAKQLLRIPAAITQHDTLLSTLCEVSDQTVLDEIDLTAFAVTTYNEKFDVDWSGVRNIAVNYRPLLSVVALTLDGTLKPAANYYFTTPGAIKLTGAADYLPVGRQLVEVCYTAGFSTVPEDLKHAATLIVASHFNQGAHVGLARESVGSYSYGMGGSGGGVTIPVLALRILSKYRRIFPRPAGGVFA